MRSSRLWGCPLEKARWRFLDVNSCKDAKGFEETEVQSSSQESLSALRKTKRIPQAIQYVQTLFQKSGAERRDSRGNEGELVRRSYGNRPYRRHAYKD